MGGLEEKALDNLDELSTVTVRDEIFAYADGESTGRAEVVPATEDVGMGILPTPGVLVEFVKLLVDVVDSCDVVLVVCVEDDELVVSGSL